MQSDPGGCEGGDARVGEGVGFERGGTTRRGGEVEGLQLQISEGPHQDVYIYLF